jgi:hypothetical protein
LSNGVLAQKCWHGATRQHGLDHIKEQLTASHPSFPLPSHLDNPLIPPIHLNDTIRRYGTLERMAVGEGDEEVRWSIRVLGVDVFQSWEIAMVIVIV